MDESDRWEERDRAEMADQQREELNAELDELKGEVERLSWRQLTFYDKEGKVVLEMPIGPHGCRWTAGTEPEALEVARVEVA